MNASTDHASSYDWTLLHDPAVAAIHAPGPELMKAERDARDEAALMRAGPPPELYVVDAADPTAEGWEDGEVTPESLHLAEHAYPEPVDCGTLRLSGFGGVQYVDGPHHPRSHPHRGR